VAGNGTIMMIAARVASESTQSTGCHLVCSIEAKGLR
jgi:hypothetical protein